MRSGLWTGWGVLLLFTCGSWGCRDDGSGSSYETQFIGTWGTGDLLDGQLASPTCIALDPESGNIYTGDKTAQSRPLVHIFSPQGQFIDRWELPYSTGFIEDMVIASDGSVYATDAFGRILHLDSSGSLIESWGAGGGLTGTANPFADDVALGEDELLYVAYSAGHVIRVLDRQGNIVRSWGLTTPFYPNAIAINGAGYVYAAEYNRIHKFKNDGELVRSWDTPFFLTTTRNPYDLAIMDNGDVLLIQEATAVHRFTSEGTLIESWSAEGSLMAGYASDIETDPDRDIVYTLGLRAFGVEAHGETGELLDTIGEPPSTAPGQFYLPARIIVTTDGSVVVRDGFRIQRFSGEGLYQNEWSLFSLPEQFQSDLTSTPDGSIVVGVGGGLRRYSPGGDVLDEWNSGSSYFHPIGMDGDEAGRIWITDSLRNRLIVLSKDWQGVDYWGTSGQAPGELSRPQAVAAREGLVAVADRNGVQVFSQDGDFLVHLGRMLGRRLAIAGGKLYVSDTGGNVTVFNLAQARLGLGASEIATIPHHGGETRPFLIRDVTATPDGDVYVLSPVLGKVYQYRFGEAAPSTPTAAGPSRP